MKIELSKEVTPPNPKTDWFRSKHVDAIYRRGKNGMCIDLVNGTITPYEYVGAVYEDFEKGDYEPLYPGTEITITL